MTNWTFEVMKTKLKEERAVLPSTNTSTSSIIQGHWFKIWKKAHLLIIINLIF